MIHREGRTCPLVHQVSHENVWNIESMTEIIDIKSFQRLAEFEEQLTKEVQAYLINDEFTRDPSVN